MTAKTAKPRVREEPKRVLFFVYPGIKLLDLAGPLQVFCDAEDVRTGERAYRTETVSLNGGEIATDTGLSIATDPCSSWFDHSGFTLIVVGGDGSRIASRNPQVTAVIRRLSKHAERIASVCTGAFVLAASGLLDTRRAVTHWQSCDELASAYPTLRVETDPIYIRDGNVWTSAGVTAGIDMALAMVNEDIGRYSTLSLAKSLVTYAVRPGGQSQFSVVLDRQTSDRFDRFEMLHFFISSNLDKDLRVEALAERVNMSPRNFARIYAAETGMTPGKAVEAIRTEAAQQLLENTRHSIARVAELCGFGDVERMRRAFLKILKVSPLDYRERFGVPVD